METVMKLNGINGRLHAKDIMERDFPILDSSVPLLRGVKKVNSSEVCVIVKNGYVKGYITHDDLLRALMYSKTRDASLESIRLENNIASVQPDEDILEVIKLMQNVDAIVVKDKDSNRISGIITKRDLLEIQPELFEQVF